MICFVNAFDSFISVIISKTFQCTSLLCLEYILQDGSSKALQLPLHTSKLTLNG